MSETTAIKAKIDSLIGIHSRDGYYTAALLTPDDLAEIRDRIAAVEAENDRLRKDRLDWVGATFHEEDRVAELEAENAKLAAFAREIIEPAFDGQDVDGGTIQRVALHYGLLAESRYDPEKHGPSFAEPGDQWFTYAGPLAPTTPPNAR
jgi:hypothetical protein